MPEIDREAERASETPESTLRSVPQNPKHTVVNDSGCHDLHLFLRWCLSEVSEILSSTPFISQGCSALLAFLAQHPTAASLELFGNRIGMLPAQKQTVKNRPDATHSRHVFHVHAGNSSCSLIPPLLKLQTLTRLKLGDNNVSAEGMVALWVVCRARRRTDFALFANWSPWEQGFVGVVADGVCGKAKTGFADAQFSGAEYIARGLSNQRSLIQLHLGGNNIGDHGLIAIGMSSCVQMAMRKGRQRVQPFLAKPTRYHATVDVLQA